jgi:hypothetical protein
VLIGFVAWLVIAITADGRNRAGATATSLGFERDLESGRLADAYALTTRRFQQRMTFDEFKELIDRHPAITAPQGAYRRKDERLMPDHKFVSDEFTYETVITNEAQVDSFTYLIIAEQGQWRVDSLTFR